ncbi:hypothetical protein [Streptomyces sp. NPDC093225]|uniref:hypothetical protein n=1 Tax=Streptomyces sp. NPDC093225 TaxID=3366034 RepID=UPI0038047BDC
MSVETAAPDALLRALGRFTTVPADLARYETSAHTAAQALRATPEQVLRLAGAGLPHRDDPELGPLFDYDDVMNVGMFCGTGQTVPELGLRFLMRFAGSAAHGWFEPREWEVGVHPARTAGGGERSGGAADGAGLPAVTTRVPDFAAPGVTGLSPAFDAPLLAGGYRSEVRLDGARHEVRDRRVLAAWDDVVGPLAAREVVYQTVPEALRADHGRAWELGVVDCIVASRLLAERLRAEGFEARARRGYLLGLFGSDHAWCEVVEDGVAKSLDPVFAFVATVGDERGVKESPEFAAACRGSRFNRLMPCVTDDAEPLVYFDGEPAPYWAMAGVSARPRRTP